MTDTVSTSVQETSAPPVVTFFSDTRELYISAQLKRHDRLMDGRVVTRAVEKVIRFRPIGQEPYGKFETTDPEIVEYLKNRMLRFADVFLEDEYNRRTIPSDKQIHTLNTELERSLEARNRLQRDLEAKQQELDAMKASVVAAEFVAPDKPTQPNKL